MALTRCSALEAADSGVRINCVAPSFANHPFLDIAVLRVSNRATIGPTGPQQVEIRLRDRDCP